MSYAARVYYISDGVTLQYAVPFPYLDEADVRLFISNEDVTLVNLFTFSGAGTVLLAAAITAGTTFELRRTTPSDAMEVIYQGGSLSSPDLNKANLQLLYLAQEAADQSTYLLNLIESLPQDGGGGGGTTVLDRLSSPPASLFIDINVNNQKRLNWDPQGDGAPPLPLPVNNHARAFFRAWTTVPGDDSSSNSFWIGSLLAPWDPANPPTQRRSRNLMSVKLITQQNGVPDPTDNTVIWPQAACGMAMQVSPDSGVTFAKCEGLVIGALEAAPVYDTDGTTIITPSHVAKLVAAQLITVKYVRGPLADDKTQFADDDSTGSGDITGVDLGAYTLRLNAGTVGGDADPSLFFRSWASTLVGGRAGYLNGFCIGPRHNSQGVNQVTDGDGVHGTGGCWGGRSFWHSDTFAVYCKDNSPGWIVVGGDRVPNDGTDSEAMAPVDIINSLTGSRGNLAVHWNGAQLLRGPLTGYKSLAGTATTDASALNTASVTLPQLAQVVKGILDGLHLNSGNGHGLFTN